MNREQIIGQLLDIEIFPNTESAEQMADILLELVGDKMPVIASEHDAQSAPGKFKGYVHKRLDDAGVPTDPYPDRTESTGCRIGGRLDWVIARMVTSPAPESGKNTFPGGYVVPQGYEWTGEMRLPRKGELFLDVKAAKTAVVAEFDDGTKLYPILRKIPSPAPEFLVDVGATVAEAIKDERERVKTECMALLRHQTQFDAADMVEEFLK